VIEVNISSIKISNREYSLNSDVSH
jgi:hypothetical protein